MLNELIKELEREYMRKMRGKEKTWLKIVRDKYLSYLGKFAKNINVELKKH